MQKYLPLRYLAVAAILLGAVTAAKAAANTDGSRAVEGVYSLEGVREMAATLILRPGNVFEYGAIYGGADPRANGKWSVEDDVVHLVADSRKPQFTKVEQNHGPLSEMANSTGIRPMMAVSITTPSLDMRWSDVDVVFKFANDRTRKGTTNRSGVVYAGARQEPEWKDVPITEVGIALPEDASKFFWIKVKDRDTTRIAVEFDPGSMAQAFREGYLEIEKGKPLRLVGTRDQGELHGTYVWKRPAESAPIPRNRSDAGEED